jgi:hypothetical protein
MAEMEGPMRGRIASPWMRPDCSESARPLCTAISGRWAKRQHDNGGERMLRLSQR